MTIDSAKGRSVSVRYGGFARWVTLALVLLALGCRAPQPPKPVVLSSVFRSEKLSAIDGAIVQSIASNRCPGGVFWLERNGVVYSRAYGHRSVDPSLEPASLDTIYDAASLTKVLATTPAVAWLIERGRIDPEKPLAHYLPAFGIAPRFGWRRLERFRQGTGTGLR